VSTSHIQAVSQGRRVPMFRDPVLSSVNHRWAGFVLEESHTKMESVARGYLPNTMLLLCTGRSGTAHWKDRGVHHHRHITPGTLSIGRSNCELQSSWATSTWSRIVVQLDGAKLRSIAPYDIDVIQASFPPVLTTRDGRLAGLILAMRDEVKAGCPSGRLFAESISMAVLAYLAGRYATPGDTHRASSLSPAQRRSISDYVRANLATDISVTELAAIVSMSPAHFFSVVQGIIRHCALSLCRTAAGRRGKTHACELESVRKPSRDGFRLCEPEPLREGLPPVHGRHAQTVQGGFLAHVSESKRDVRRSFRRQRAAVHIMLATRSMCCATPHRNLLGSSRIVPECAGTL
jgi:AraC family transcriptional regulator